MTFYVQVISERSRLWFCLISLPRSMQLITTFVYPDVRLTSASQMLLCDGFARMCLVALTPFCVMGIHLSCPPLSCLAVPCSIPQGSALGPLLILHLHASSRTWLISYHFTAEYTHLHLPFDPSEWIRMIPVKKLQSRGKIGVFLILGPGCQITFWCLTGIKLNLSL